MYAALAASLLLAACSGPRQVPIPTPGSDGAVPADSSSPRGLADTQELSSGEILLGLMTSRTGPLAGVDRGMINAAWLARSEINAAGGVLGKKLGIVVEDDGSSADGAESAFQRLVADERVAAAVGPTTFSALRAVTGADNTGPNAPSCSASPMALISASAEVPEAPCRAGAPVAFSGIGPSMALTHSEYIRQNVEGDSAAFLGVLPDGGFSNERLLGWDMQHSVVTREHYPAPDPQTADYATMDFAEKVGALVAERPAVLMLATYFTDGTRIAAELGTHFTAAYRPKIIGWRFHMFDDFIAAAPDMFEGMLGLAPRPPDNDAAYTTFAAAYQEAFGASPPLFAEGVYDAVYALAFAIESAGRAEREAVLETLRSVANPPGDVITVGSWAMGVDAIRSGRDIDYEGASGTNNWNEDGWSSNTNWLVWTVRSGRIETVSSIRPH